MNTHASAIRSIAAISAIALFGIACGAEKSRNPLSPTVAGPLAGVSITTPEPVSPINGSEVVNNAPLRFVFNNAATNGERPLWYVLELASDTAFAQKLYTNPKVPAGSGSQTSLVVSDAKLNVDTTYYWRVKADDGANASEFSSAARFDFVVPVFIEAPTPLSPANGETIANTSPSLVVNNGRLEGRPGAVYYRFQVARDAGFNDVVLVAEVERNGSGRTTYNAAGMPGGQLLYWRAMGHNGTFNSSFSGTQTFRTPSAPAPPPPAPPPPPGTPGSTPGCINGVLADPRTYFFSLIGRREGDPAHDWYDVLSRSGLRAGPGRFEILPPNAPNFGITQQVNSSGILRGRLHLPTTSPNEFGWYIHDVDILSDPSASRWVWRPLGGPAYVPRPCQ